MSARAGRLWHRLRGHRVRSYERHFITSRGAIESGRIARGWKCSCGAFQEGWS